MRGEDSKQEAMFSYLSPEKRVPAEHPLRPIRARVDMVLAEMSPRFAKLYSDVGRPSIAPERLLRALLLQIFYSVRSERLLDMAVSQSAMTNGLRLKDVLAEADLQAPSVERP
jgi:transposase